MRNNHAMNPAHLHVILNHIPVVGVPIGFGLLFYGLLRKSAEVKRASLLVFIAMALIAIPTFLAGKAAEDVVEHLPDVREELIENHERAATLALIVTLSLGAVASAALLWSFRSTNVATSATILLLIFSGGVSGWLGRTANLGGKIRHTELRDGAAVGEGDENERVEGGERRGRNRRGRDR